MDFKQWADLLGRPADDAAVCRALAEAGISERIKIGKKELSTREDLEGRGMTIVFTSETILRPDDPGAVVGRPIVSAVMVVLDQPSKKNLYEGPLPYGLEKADSLAALRGRLGTPGQTNERYRTDAWEIDGMTLAASYSKDLQSLTQLSLSLPGSH